MRLKKKIYLIFLFLIFVLSLLVVSGATLKHHYSSEKKVEKYFLLRKLFVPLAELPSNLKHLRLFNKHDPSASSKHLNKKKFERYLSQNKNNLLVISRFDGNLKKSIVEIVSTKNFEVIHSYNFDSKKIINSFDFSKEILQGKKKDFLLRSKKLGIRNPLINSDGSLIGHFNYSPIFKLDICSNLIWVNDKQLYRHKITSDSNNDIWVGALMFPYSEYIKKNKAESFGLFDDDAISKVSQNGKLLYSKSVIEILIENKKLPENFLNEKNPIYLDDVEPIKSDTKYWKKGDILISAKNLSAIIHYRPSSNKIINYITGPFYMQHDVNIISDKEISIFNNNNTLDESSKFSEVIIYNFENKTFTKKFNSQLKENEFKTPTSGIARVLKDGSLFLEEQIHGRLLFFNSQGEKEWEYLNKSNDGKIYRINWSRLIEDEILIFELINKIQSTNCNNM